MALVLCVFLCALLSQVLFLVGGERVGWCVVYPPPLVSGFLGGGGCGRIVFCSERGVPCPGVDFLVMGFLFMLWRRVAFSSRYFLLEMERTELLAFGGLGGGGLGDWAAVVFCCLVGQSLLGRCPVGAAAVSPRFLSWG